MRACRGLTAPKQTDGFTLVELLITMVISLLALSAIYSTFQNQHKSYIVQEQVAAAQQNLRSAMFLMESEMRMAGCDPTGNANTGIGTANADSIAFTLDYRGDTAGSNPDGNPDDANEDLSYALSGGDLSRTSGGTANDIAENIDAIDFVYLDGSSPPTVLNPGRTSVAAGDLSRIRSVEITLVARTSRPVRDSANNTIYRNQRGSIIFGPAGDNVNRRALTVTVKCRNLGL